MSSGSLDGNEGEETGGKRGSGKRGKGKGQLKVLTDEMPPPLTAKRRPDPAEVSSNSAPKVRKRDFGRTSPRQPDSSSTSSRPTFFLLGKAPTSLMMTKLPKAGPVLGRLLSLLETLSLTDAAESVKDEVKSVWLHHFGPRLVLGKEFGLESEPSDVGKIMIKADRHVKDLIVDVYKLWRNLEKESRRPERASKPGFLKKHQDLLSNLDLPLDIRWVDAGKILQNSGILDWKEELSYLESQMTREQPGGLDSLDMRQKKRDDRKLKEKLTRDAKLAKEKAEQDRDQRIDIAEKENIDEEKENIDENDNDTEYVVGEKKKLIDVMGKISLTCDAKNISVRDRIVIAGSVAKAVGVDINETNINRSTAWRKGQRVRLEKAKEIKEDFIIPEKVVVHWDGKTLTLRGRIQSKRVCIYLSGVDAEQTRKLLGIPQAASGTGEDEFEMVKEYLVKWGVRGEVVGMVFDTTSSNSGEHSGACRCTYRLKYEPDL